MYAEVVVNRSILKRTPTSLRHQPNGQVEPADSPSPSENPLAVTFHYHIPAALFDRLQVGHLVSVPFRTEQLSAIVVNLSSTSPVAETRPVSELLDPQPVMTPAQIELARWLSHEYLTPLDICLTYFLPPGSNHKSEFVLKPATVAKDNRLAQSLAAPARLLLTTLRQKGSVRVAEANPQAAQTLLEFGLAYKQSVLSKPSVGPKMERTVELLISPAEVEAVLPTLGRTSKRADLLRHLAELADPLPPLAEVLAAVGYQTDSGVKALAEQGWLNIIPAESRVTVAPTSRQRWQPADKSTIINEGPSAETLKLPQADKLPTSETTSPAVTEQRILRYLATQPQPILWDTVLADTGVEETVINQLIDQQRLVRFDEPTRVTLTVPREQLTDIIIELRNAHKHVEVLQVLAAEEGPLWIGWVYTQTQATLTTLRDLEQAGYISLDESRRWRDPLADRVFTLEEPPTLTPKQQTVWQEILAIWQRGAKPSGIIQYARPGKQPILLHGVTGSGKTEIYLRAIEATLRAGQQALMLVPEITLATQAIERVSARFPDHVAVWHSALSLGERYDNWDRVRHNELPIVVGPRSALFAPLQNLGLIVVDEEHDAAYKQQHRSPFFQAREAALELARLTEALIILGSASPDVSTYRRAEVGEYRLLQLPHRPLAHTKHVAVQRALFKRGQSLPPANQLTAELTALPLPQVEIVDLRQELKAGNRTIFSQALQTAIYETLSRGEQVILFLNRRGTATFVNCRDCGYVQQCPQCDTTLTYHAHGEQLICHYCGYRQSPATVCPDCQSERIRYFGLGTQRVEETVRQMFPNATPLRWDQDTSRKPGSHYTFLEHFIAGRANIMVGTQMVTKGLDLPLVTLVGVISADTSLFLPDFRAAERTFQLLMQVAGRAGRSPLGGRVIIQSYNADLPVIQAAARHDYLGFYQQELAFRREQQYPPFKRLALLLYSGSGEERAAAEAQAMRDRLEQYVRRAGLPAVEFFGPTPHYVYRLRSQYRWFVLLRANNPADILRPLMPLPHGWRVDVDPISLL